MAKEVKLNSSDWCDLVFDGKNKSYGAYALRQSSSKRHIVAFGVILLFTAAVAAVPAFLEAVKPNTPHIAMEDTVKISDIELEKQQKEQEVIQREIAPPPVEVRATITFTPPTIVDDPNVDETREMRTQTELNQNNNLQISIVDNFDGSTSANAVSPEELVEYRNITEEPPSRPFEHVQHMPQFPGGESELIKYLGTSIKYPAQAAEAGIEGRVVLRFVVGKDGKVSDIEILRTLDPSCDREATRVVKGMPKWIPGMQNGQNVAVYYTLPILFKLKK